MLQTITLFPIMLLLALLVLGKLAITLVKFEVIIAFHNFHSYTLI